MGAVTSELNTCFKSEAEEFRICLQPENWQNNARPLGATSAHKARVKGRVSLLDCGKEVTVAKTKNTPQKRENLGCGMGNVAVVQRQSL